jgi:hypothetical protein
MGEKKVARISRAQGSCAHNDDPNRTGKRRSVTATMLAQRGLPRPDGVPRVQEAMRATVLSLPLDSRAAFLVSQMDGKTTLQEIIDLSPLTREDTITIVGELRQLGLIVFL